MTGTWVHFAIVDGSKCAKCDGTLGEGRQLAVDSGGKICYVCAECAEELTTQGQVKRMCCASWADKNDPIIGIPETEAER